MKWSKIYERNVDLANYTHKQTDKETGLFTNLCKIIVITFLQICIYSKTCLRRTVTGRQQIKYV